KPANDCGTLPATLRRNNLCLMFGPAETEVQDAMQKMWMVRAETGGRLYEVFRDQSIIAIGWVEIGELSARDDRQTIAARVRNFWPEWKPQAVAMSAGQLFRFR